jgi:phytol kinase
VEVLLIMKNIIGIFVSYLFVFAIILASTLLTHRRILSGESSRKFIHIGVSNWWIIAMIFFDTPWYAAIPPLSFVVINYLSYKDQIIGAMESQDGRGGLGTVYFAISLLVLSLITFRPGSNPYIGALGILIMGYGDGFAAVFGSKFNSYTFHILGSKKTLIGTLAMFVFSFLAAFIILSIYDPISSFRNSLILALFATVLEAFSPAGFDNLTVPLLVPLLYVILM